MEEALRLDERLAAIERMIPRGARVADIGADHGFLGVHLLLEGISEAVQFLDISEVSLRKAYRLARRYDLLERARFSVGDGLAALVEVPDVAVIAGMGGVTIAGIVERGRDAIKDSLLVMQPNVGAPELRRALVRTGFGIVDEDIVRAGGRWYVIIAARAGSACYDERELLAGPVILRRRHPNISGYAQFRIRVAEKALAGAEKSGGAVADGFRREIRLWKEIVLECAQP